MIINMVGGSGGGISVNDITSVTWVTPEPTTDGSTASADRNAIIKINSPDGVIKTFTSAACKLTQPAILLNTNTGVITARSHMAYISSPNNAYLAGSSEGSVEAYITRIPTASQVNNKDTQISATYQLNTQSGTTSYITPGYSAQSQTIANSGYYLLGNRNVYVYGNSNLVSSNIKSGITIFGVTGSLDAAKTDTQNISISNNADGTIFVSYYRTNDLSYERILSGDSATITPISGTNICVVMGDCVSIKVGSSSSGFSQLQAWTRCIAFYFSSSYSSGSIRIDDR